LRISVITPFASALISRLTLSVSNSRIGVSSSTESPSFTSHSAIVPSVMDSANSGITISLITEHSFFLYLAQLQYYGTAPFYEYSVHQLLELILLVFQCIEAFVRLVIIHVNNHKQTPKRPYFSVLLEPIRSLQYSVVFLNMLLMFRLEMDKFVRDE